MAQNEDMAEAFLLMEEQYHISISELVHLSGLSSAEIEELVDFGVFEPQGSAPVSWLFSTQCIATARVAYRLRNDFELNTAGIALALTYLERIQNLEARLRTLECQQLR